MIRLILIAILLLATFLAKAQSLTQTIRGIVLDKDSKSAIESAKILLENGTNLNANSDANGFFVLENVPVGRQTITILMIGYKPQTVSDIEINAAKEIVLEISLEQITTTLDAVVLQSKNSKTKTVNDMIAVSGRTFSTNEANRFAGSQNDPSRMARNYAGVSGSTDQRNDIIIRGNAPQGLLWQIEGIPSPNPNHFSGQGTTGGPISIINTKMLSNSDFLTGAFPAEYGNATSGVFDVKLRNGNNKKTEKTIQIGALGIEALLEGPFAKNSNSSYLIGYRYSTLSILSKAGVKLGFASVPYYQDLSFKLNFVTKKAGTFKVFGIGGISSTAFYEKNRDSTQFSPANKGENVYFSSKTGLIGASHTYFFNARTSIKSSIGASYERNDAKRDSIQLNKTEKRTGGFGYSSYKLVFNSYLNKKINAKNTVKLGFLTEQIFYKTKDSVLLYRPLTGKPFWGFNNDFSGNSQTIQAYGQWKYKLNDDLTFNSGLHFQQFLLNNKLAIEPRFAINYQIKQNQTLSFGYGLHNQLQPFAMYFYRNKNAVNNTIETNKNLDFTKSNQFVLGYDINFNKDFRLKFETYYQYLSSIPVEKFSSSYSVLNYGATFANTYKENLVNNGTGQNYGAELTLEKFFSNNYYFLITTSVFKSTYKGSDKIERNTAFNGNYVFNALTGCEFKLQKNFSLLIDGKVTLAGGLRYSPIDLPASKASNEAVYSDSEAFSKQNATYFKPDIKFTVRKNFVNKIALEWALDIQNFVNYKNVFLNWYDKNTQQENVVFQNGRFPTVQLKLEF